MGPRGAVVGLLLAALAGCAPSWRDAQVPMRAVGQLDPARYAGRWYEIARFPVAFQEGCTATMAEYALRPDGRIAVTNSCRMGAPDGPLRRISGSARVVEGGRLSVRLGWIPVPAPYWVLWVDEEYATAVVGVPSGRAGWVLARSPTISPERLQAARDVLEGAGHDLTRLRMTVH